MAKKFEVHVKAEHWMFVNADSATEAQEYAEKLVEDQTDNIDDETEKAYEDQVEIIDTVLCEEFYDI